MDEPVGAAGGGGGLQTAKVLWEGVRVGGAWGGSGAERVTWLQGADTMAFLANKAAMQ